MDEICQCLQKDCTRKIERTGEITEIDEIFQETKKVIAKSNFRNY